MAYSAHPAVVIQPRLGHTVKTSSSSRPNDRPAYGPVRLSELSRSHLAASLLARLSIDNSFTQLGLRNRLNCSCVQSWRSVQGRAGTVSIVPGDWNQAPAAGPRGPISGWVDRRLVPASALAQPRSNIIRRTLRQAPTLSRRPAVHSWIGPR